MENDQALELIGSVLKSIIKYTNGILIPHSSVKFFSFVKEGGDVLMSTVKLHRGILVVTNDLSILLHLYTQSSF